MPAARPVFVRGAGKRSLPKWVAPHSRKHRRWGGVKERRDKFHTLISCTLITRAMKQN